MALPNHPSFLPWAVVLALSAGLWAGEPPAPGSISPIFNGRSLEGWEDGAGAWRVEDGAIAGGSAQGPGGETLLTSRDHADFILRLRFRLEGGDQAGASAIVRGRRDLVLAGPGGAGAIREAGGQGRVLFPPDPIALDPVLRRGDWNECAVRAEGPRLTLWLNGTLAADFHEEDPGAPSTGRIGIRVHGAGASLLVKEITVEALPAPPGSLFAGAPPPAGPPKPSPLAPEEERATFSLPPGFEIELVLSEADGAAKPITVVWDHAGRLWTMTALEYPVDANDDPGAASALYAEPRRDRILVLDDPHGPAPRRPRVFADGLAIPLGLLPWKDGAFVQHGTDILFLRDTDGDGRAETREVVLTGFGIGDSHLLPHQFTRAPGGWVLVAQGAFNNSRVRTKDGATADFNRTLLGRFTPDGRRFETIGWGPCNIWGLVLNGEGEVFIQEANDYGYPVMPFHAGACYPGCTPFPKPYAPAFPGLSRLGMGGTGLSGLALSDERGGFPGPYAGVFYVANPVTRRIQAVKLLRDGPRWSLLKLPDFLLSSDEWFRPVAIHFGPDGCLYIADWYNKVISHNEVPRNHPDRDKTRGRIWRVRHAAQSMRDAIDFTKVPETALLEHLGGDSLWRAHAAWQEIADRNAKRLGPALAAIVHDGAARAARRIQALWALEELGLATPALLRPLLREADRNIRREAARALGGGFAANGVLEDFESLAGDPDPEVRAEAIRWAAPLAGAEPRALELLVRMGHGPLSGPLIRGTHDGRPIKAGEAYDREFERYLIRAALERHPAATARFLASDGARTFPDQNRLFAALALEPRASAVEVARVLSRLPGFAGEEEVLRLAEFPEAPGVGGALRAVLEDPIRGTAAAEALLRGRTRLDAARLTPLLAPVAERLLMEMNGASRGLAIRLASGFRLAAVAPRLAGILDDANVPAAERLVALRALREMGSREMELFARIAEASSDPLLREEAVIALASTPPPDAVRRILALWPRLTARERRTSLDRLVSTRGGADAVVTAAREGVLPAADVEAPVVEKAIALLGESPELEALLEELGAVARPVLRLDGRVEGYVESRISLEGPFTVEAWVRLDPGIGNEDGILGRPGGADFNFNNGHLHVFGGPGHGDRIVAKRALTPEHWTHVAVTRDGKGRFAIYLDGELDTADSRPLGEAFTDLDIGRATPGRGTGALLAELRVWSRQRSAEEIRAGFDRSLEGEPPPPGLVKHCPGGGPWGKLHGSARLSRTIDPPPLLTAEEARAVAGRLEKYQNLAEGPGDPARGKTLAAACLACHTIGGEGAHIGPNLSGAGAMGVEAVIRSLLTPSAAMEAGYRTFRVETTGEEVLDAFLVSEDTEAVIVRRPQSEDRRIPRSEIRRASFLRRSLMPEGLLEAMSPTDVTDLFAYLKTLR